MSNVSSIADIHTLLVIFVLGFVQPQKPASGFESPSPSASNTYVPPTTPSYPDGFSPYNPPATAVTPNDEGMISLPSIGNYSPASGGNGGTV
jgi:hypothetical protein